MLRKCVMLAAAALLVALTATACGTGPSEPMPPGDMPMQLVADTVST